MLNPEVLKSVMKTSSHWIHIYTHNKEKQWIIRKTSLAIWGPGGGGGGLQ